MNEEALVNCYGASSNDAQPSTYLLLVLTQNEFVHSESSSLSSDSSQYHTIHCITELSCAFCYTASRSFWMAGFVVLSLIRLERRERG